MSRRQMRLDHNPLRIGQISLITQRLAAMLLSGGRRPHGGSRSASTTFLESHRHRPLNPFRNGLSGGRGFTSPLTEEIRNPGSRDQFSGLRLIAYLDEGASPEADEFVGLYARLHFTDDEWQEFGEENPWYEWPLGDLEWSHPPGTVFADFIWSAEGEEFTFNGFWQIRQGSGIPLETARVTLLTKLPHFNGYSLSPQEQAPIAWLLRALVAQRNHETDDFGSCIDESFLAFWDRERAALRQRLVAQVVEVARELCRTGRFHPSLTLHIRDGTGSDEMKGRTPNRGSTLGSDSISMMGSSDSSDEADTEHIRIGATLHLALGCLQIVDLASVRQYLASIGH